MQLSDYLKSQKLTQGEFARKVGISDAYLSRILNGWRGVSVQVAHRIEEETGREVSLADLLAIERQHDMREAS